MTRSLRLIPTATVAVGITCGLFLFMHQLILSGYDQQGDLAAISGIHFGPVEIPDEMLTRNRKKPDKPLPPETPPPPPKMQVTKLEKPAQNLPRMDLPDLDLDMTGGAGMYLGNFQQVDQTAEGDVIPVVVIRPIYPREAANNGTEGWVEIEFTITEAGTVKDARVINAQPPRVFNREAIRAILKWKFKPRVVDGEAVERRATQTIDFTLADS